MPEDESHLSDDHRVLGGLFTVGQLQRDYRNAFAVPKSLLDSLEEQLRELEELRKHEAIGEVHEETRSRLRFLTLGLPSVVARIRRMIAGIPGYRQHLITVFERYDCPDADLVRHLHRKHPANKQLGQVSRALRRMVRENPKQPDKVLDYRRMSLLLIKALQLASSSEKPDKEDRINVNTLVYDKLWKRQEETRLSIQQAMETVPEQEDR